MIDAVFYVVDNGTKWRALPADRRGEEAKIDWAAILQMTRRLAKNAQCLPRPPPRIQKQAP